MEYNRRQTKMKKFLSFSILATLLVMGTLMVKANAYDSKTTSSDEVTLAMASSSAYRVTCYRIERASFGWKSITKHGTYDEDAGTLTVEDSTYTVYSNPAYGEDSMRGRYIYKAGPYYFNA